VPGALHRVALGILLLFGVTACQYNEEKVLALPDADGSLPPRVTATAETAPVANRGDAADDPVVLVDGDQAWIAGTDKQFGLRVYELSGREVLALDVGRLNNVDAVPQGPGTYLMAASNRTTLSIDLFSVELGDDIDVLPAYSIPLDFEDPYGICMSSSNDSISVFVGDKTGRVQWWDVTLAEGAMNREFRFDSQTEGCVVDAESGTLFVGEENAGIWAIDLESGDRSLIDRVGAGRLTADVEGLDIYRTEDRRYLIASSQGDNSFAVYELPGGEPIRRFRIIASAAGVDGVSETDGLAVTPIALPGYPQGILVVQDGYNVSPNENQNFKIVDWRSVAELLDAT
jgi:3-phytase